MINGKEFKAVDFEEKLEREVVLFEIKDKKFLLVHFKNGQVQVIDLEKLFFAKMV